MAISMYKGYQERTRDLALLLVFIEESLNTSLCIHELVLAREEGVTVGANFDFNARFGGPGFDYVATMASNGGLGVLRMNPLFHKNLAITNPSLGVNHSLT
jgi:hypothetical protein